MRTAAVVAATGLALLASACGGSSSPAASPQRSAALGFARCMRSHRVPGWPDPDRSGAFDKSKLTPQPLGADGALTPARVRAAIDNAGG